MEVNVNQVGQRIKSIRLSLGDSMESFGKRLNTSKASVNNWEKGVNLPNSERLKKIADLDNITVNELLYGGDYILLKNKILKAYYPNGGGEGLKDSTWLETLTDEALESLTKQGLDHNIQNLAIGIFKNETDDKFSLQAFPIESNADIIEHSIRMLEKPIEHFNKYFDDNEEQLDKAKIDKELVKTIRNKVSSLTSEINDLKIIYPN